MTEKEAIIIEEIYLTIVPDLLKEEIPDLLGE